MKNCYKSEGEKKIKYFSQSVLFSKKKDKAINSKTSHVRCFTKLQNILNFRINFGIYTCVLFTIVQKCYSILYDQSKI